MAELKSNIEWKKWGVDDPLWGVASWPGKEKGGASPWTEDEFYALGISDWQDFIAVWSQYGVDDTSCLEIGCGAGRLTKQIAGYFKNVMAVDVSEDMIQRARQAIERKNVELFAVDGLHLPLGDSSVSAIFSAHVLQHLDSVDIGLQYFREFFRVLKPGGTVMIHLPVYQLPLDAGIFGWLMTAEYRLYRMLGHLRANLYRRSGKKTMRGTPYPIRSLAHFLEEVGFKNVQFRIFSLRSNHDLHPFVMATK